MPTFGESFLKIENRAFTPNGSVNGSIESGNLSIAISSQENLGFQITEASFEQNDSWRGSEFQMALMDYQNAPLTSKGKFDHGSLKIERIPNEDGLTLVNAYVKGSITDGKDTLAVEGYFKNIELRKEEYEAE